MVLSVLAQIVRPNTRLDQPQSSGSAVHPQSREMKYERKVNKLPANAI